MQVETMLFRCKDQKKLQKALKTVLASEFVDFEKEIATYDDYPMGNIIKLNPL